MDTGTHLVMGIGLAGLAMADPVVASDLPLQQAVIIGTIVGSQAPDLDGLLRLKSNELYIRNHRGITHSLPAIIIWTAVITVILQLFFKGSLPWGHLGGWVLLAVVLHVFTDLFNAYGTQAMRPFSSKWISWNIIHIFDPFLFGSHIVAIFLWAAHFARPEQIFPPLYLMLMVYFAWRTYASRRVLQQLPKWDAEQQEGEKYYAIPTVLLSNWNIVKHCSDGSYRIGELKGKRLRWVDQVSCSNHPAVEVSKSSPVIRSFLYFTSFACADVIEHSWGNEVRWSDIRYRHRKQYPFVAVVLLDEQNKTVGSYVGWLSDERLIKRLKIDTY